MGWIVIDPEAPSFDGAVAHVRLESAAPAGAPADSLSEIRVADVSHRVGTSELIGFSIASPVPVGNARLRAWVDVDGHGPAAPDDLFSTESVPLAPGPCVIRVEGAALGPRGAP